MNTRKATFTKEEREEIGQEFSRSHLNQVYKRLLILKLKALDGMSSDEAAKISGLCHASVNRIIRRYKAKGMEAIVGRGHNNGKRYMKPEQGKTFLVRFREEGEVRHVIEVRAIYGTSRKR